ncbi:hypothetical protein GCM10009077_10940 [Roseibium denhamense]
MAAKEAQAVLVAVEAHPVASAVEVALGEQTAQGGGGAGWPQRSIRSTGLAYCKW